ncbi:hypothetical protein [Flavobacterium sp.]|uniref:hypothetical protein n=1 Tax=Flavobacterium sp. TaxID=239 RepID=UPI00248A6B57|nr:hypothetical protein [Flavobacterium sp.]MDI1316459.1 hypothetical protein [Flavobacterium sp.]
MRKIIIFVILISFSSCNTNHFVLYNSDKTNGLDFSNGKWLMGNIDVNSHFKEELTELAIKNFESHLGERVKYALNEKSLLIANKVPTEPSKAEIEKLRIGTGYDYYINIKCQNSRNDISDFKLIEHNYYLKQMSFAQIIVEVYDLKAGKTIYTQTARGNIDENASITSRPMYNVIMGCYKKIWDDIEKKSLKQ